VADSRWMLIPGAQRHGSKHLVNVLAELAALGLALVSLRDNLDLSTFDATKHGCKNEATAK